MRVVVGSGLALLLALSSGIARGDDGTKDDVKKRLDALISLDVNNKPFDEVLDIIRERSQLNIILENEARDKIVEQGENVSIKLDNVKLRSAMKLVLAQKNLGAIYRGGALVVMPKENIKKKVYVKIYNIQDLLMTIPDFVAPKMNPVAGMSSGSGASLFGGNETGGGGGTFGMTLTIAEEPRENKIEDTFIKDMIRNNTGAGAWDENENANIDIANGMLVITQTRGVHDEVQKMLIMLRQLR